MYNAFYDFLETPISRKTVAAISAKMDYLSLAILREIEWSTKKCTYLCYGVIIVTNHLTDSTIPSILDAVDSIQTKKVFSPLCTTPSNML